MKTKKVILFIVEGVTDKVSIGGIIDKIISSSQVKFYITGGDITSDRFSTATNAITKVNEHVKAFLEREVGIKKSDIIQIVHLIDMDGAFVDESQIKEDEVFDFRYTESTLIVPSLQQGIERNQKKQQVINRLSTCPKISGIAYYMYYFSCNLEHVLHNEIQLADELKMIYAEKFSDDYYRNEKEFVNFIKDESFAVQGDYKETWSFIKLNNYSLKRYSNFHLFFLTNLYE